MNKILQSTSYCTAINVSNVVHRLQHGDNRIYILNEIKNPLTNQLLKTPNIGLT